VHARVDFQPDAQPGLRGQRLEQGELPVLVDEGFESMTRCGREAVGVPESFKDHDAGAAPGFAQRERLLDARDGEPVRALERRRGRQQPVTVGIRLDDREDPAARREFADAREIVPERRGVDDCAQARAQNAPSP
jgi:hypothetical protein